MTYTKPKTTTCTAILLRTTSLFCLLLVLLPGRASWAQDDDDPYAPISVPTSARTQSAEPSNLMNPNISLVAVFLTSYRQGQALYGDDPESIGFALQEVELAFQAAIDPYFRADAYLVLDDGLQVEQLELTSLFMPSGLQLQLGQLVAEFGRQNTQHLHAWDFSDNHLPNTFLLDDLMNAPGVELSYLVPTGLRLLMVRLTAQALDAGSDGLSALRGWDENSQEPLEFEWDELRLAALGRLEAALTMSPSWTLVLGGSYLTGPSGVEDELLDSWLAGVDLYLRYRETTGRGFTTISLSAEGMRRERTFDGERVVDNGFYAQLFYRFAQRWNTALRFDWVDGDSLDELTRGSASLSFLPSEFSRLRLQYNLGLLGEEEAFGHEAFLQVEFSMGPHGAHAF